MVACFVVASPKRCSPRTHFAYAGKRCIIVITSVVIIVNYVMLQDASDIDEEMAGMASANDSDEEEGQPPLKVGPSNTE